MTRAERSTFVCAWIFPFAVTLETRSTFSTLAVVTLGAFLSRPRIEPINTTPTITAPATPIRIFHFFDIQRSSVLPISESTGTAVYGLSGRKFSPEALWKWCAQEDLNPQPPDP